MMQKQCMLKAEIEGIDSLAGEVEIQGSKNAAQKIVPATVVYPGIYVLKNMPAIEDTDKQLKILSLLGGKISRTSHQVIVDTRDMSPRTITSDIAATSTGSFLFAGALLRRFGNVKVYHPGGDQIGQRRVTWHLQAFGSLGAKVLEHEAYYEVEAGKMKGAEITFDKPSVNGTVNAIFAALGCPEETTIVNVPEEPDIDNVILFLNRAGAKITRSNGKIVVDGRGIPSGEAEIEVIPDRNDAATFAIAGALLGGPVVLNGVNSMHMHALITALREIGVNLDILKNQDGHDQLTVQSSGRPKPIDVESRKYPGFSTDWGPMFQVLMTQSEGTSTFHETIFADRFRHVSCLQEMGADIEYFQPSCSEEIYNFNDTIELQKPHAIRIRGNSGLHGTYVEASDIRAGAALALAGMAAEGITEVGGYYHVLRGYENFAGRMNTLGANIRVPDHWED